MCPLPEISRFYGIVIRMFPEPGEPHHSPHFHAYFQAMTAVYGIQPVVRIAGWIPSKQARLVEAWAEIHQADLLGNWLALTEGRRAVSIEPLS